MNHSSCDDHQAKLSELIDDGRPIPETIQRHLAICDACRSFARFCQEESTHPWAANLPPAGVQLRENVLRLPSHQRTFRPAWLILPVAAAAAISLMALIGWQERNGQNHPVPPRVVLSEKEEAEIEITALRDDLDRALAQLAEPLSIFENLTPQ